jgi:hypothetical protein
MFGGRQGIPVDGVKRKKWKLQAMISGPDGGDILRGAVLQRNSAISPRNPRDAAASGRRAQADRLAAASHGLRMDGADLASCLAGTGGCARGAAGPDFHRYEVMLQTTMQHQRMSRMKRQARLRRFGEPLEI